MSTLLTGLVAKLKTFLPSFQVTGPRTMADVVADLTGEAQEISDNQQDIADAAQIAINIATDERVLAQQERDRADEFLKMFPKFS